MNVRFDVSRPTFARLLALLGALPLGIAAASLAIQDVPVFLNATNAEPLVMLALSNDEQLYHKAYTDYDDVDGDNTIDTTYTDTISYYGYFDPIKCYSYSGDPGSGFFTPTALANGPNSHYCDSVSGGGRWSGNFLNWASMARVDALRKVLFGGYRSTDTSSSTVLERTYVPPDNHAWAKFYSASDLNRYTPYDTGTYPSGITLCNVTPQGSSTDVSQTNTTSPRLRVAKGQWTQWAAEESKQCLWRSEFPPTDTGANPNDTSGGTDKIAEFTVRVQACNSSLIGSEKCKTYGSSLKPVGLLQDFADADQLKIRFGLMTGTYGKRKSGGVLRKNIARFTDEVNSADGTFTGSDGIVKSINLMRISRYAYSQPGYYGSSSQDNCPYGENSWSNGSCSNWGNPMGEIFLEALRYFVGGKSPNFSSDDSTWISGLKQATWVNPYGTASTSPVGGGASSCAKPNIMPISTSVLSFDNDEYGGASDIPSLNINNATDAVGSNEGINGTNWYVGSLGGGTTGGGSPSDVCTSMTVNNLSSVTGICPQAGGLQGSFAIAGLASFAHQSGNSLQTVSGKKIPVVDTYAVALAPPIPAIKVPVGGKTVTIIPAGYNVRDSNAMQLINFRVVSQATDNTSGTYFMNFENAPAGSDYDNDEKGYLSYTVSGNTIKVVVYQSGSSAGATQQMGYTIDGVTDSGTYYLVENNDLTVGTQQGGGTWPTVDPATIDANCSAAGFAASTANVTSEECYYVTSGSNTPKNGTRPARLAYNRGVRTHTAGASGTGELQSPLWYAAKYGGFKDTNNSNTPDKNVEWDANGDGIPDNYFPVTNASMLETQLTNAFNAILTHAGSSSAASVNSGSISSDTRIYQAKFDSSSWGGQLLAYTISSDGAIGTTPSWDASQKIPAHASRNIFTVGTSGTAIPFEWASLSSTQQKQLYPSDSSATLGQQRLDYLRGDDTYEIANSVGTFRNRDSPLGDIINSAPIYVAKPPFRYRDSIEPTAPYSAFRTANAGRTPVVYVGANDGMLHAFDASVGTNGQLPDPASSGQEKFAFIPSAVFPNLYQLSSPTYSHLYYVDGTPSIGDAFFATGGQWHTVLVSGLNKGGREIFALDVTNPDSITEANGSNPLLWEFTSAQDPDLGYTYSRPVITKLHDGSWVAIFGNGYNSTGTGHAILYIVNIQTGAIIAKLDTQSGTAVTPNGLATPTAVDVEGDGITEYVYAGDLQGNIWKFDLTNSTASKWTIPYTDSSGNPKALFTATDANGNAQPITERVQVGFGPSGNGFVVLFGTGKFLESTDRTVDTTNPRPQSFYGILDPNSGTSADLVSGRSVLQQQTILSEQTLSATNTDASGNTVTYTYNVRLTSQNTVDLASKRGWYIDLVSPNGYQAEKQISDPVLRTGKVIFTTIIPDPDPCAYGGRSWLMSLDSLSGARLDASPFDLNNDKKFNDLDAATLSGSLVTISGLQTASGTVARAGMLSGTGADYAITSGFDQNNDLSSYRQNPGPGMIGRQSWRQIR